MWRTSLEVIGVAGMGLSFHCFEEGENEFAGAIASLLSAFSSFDVIILVLTE